MDNVIEWDDLNIPICINNFILFYDPDYYSELPWQDYNANFSLEDIIDKIYHARYKVEFFTTKDKTAFLLRWG